MIQLDTNDEIYDRGRDHVDGEMYEDVIIREVYNKGCDQWLYVWYNYFDEI